MPGFTRPMWPGEERDVARLLDEAFGGTDESRLVKALRDSGDIAGEMVLPMGERIVGYYALSQFRAPQGWLCLAPLAVAPDLQGHSFSRRMIRQLTEWAKLTGQYVVVMGQVELYEKFGFRKDRAAHLTSPYPIEHTLLAGPGEDAPKATLRYPKPFEQL
ncbi:MAG: N-acetyltransferase [Marinovum algicola]|uniref:GNAT family N-acetyltransferase n=1 Tax=Marinovum algicola TaxID=42444 RepID=UPI0032EDC1FB